jgi:hypothetical protein
MQLNRDGKIYSCHHAFKTNMLSSSCYDVDACKSMIWILAFAGMTVEGMGIILEAQLPDLTIFYSTTHSTPLR